MWRLVVSLVVALAVAVFAVENASPVEIKVLFWSLPKVGLAVVILISALLGAILGVVVGLGQLIRERRTWSRRMAGAVQAPGPESQAPHPSGSEAPPAREAEGPEA